jgi:hypothetical protein
MRFEITSDDHMLRITEDLVGRLRTTFATEQELHEMAGASPRKRPLDLGSFAGLTTSLQNFPEHLNPREYVG